MTNYSPVDLLRSVSRCLPAVASPPENALIAEARGLLGAYDRAELMIQSGLYTPGSDPGIDAAIACHPALEKFLAQRDTQGPQASFTALRNAMARTARPGR